MRVKHLIELKSTPLSEANRPAGREIWDQEKPETNYAYAAHSFQTSLHTLMPGGTQSKQQVFIKVAVATSQKKNLR